MSARKLFVVILIVLTVIISGIAYIFTPVKSVKGSAHIKISPELYTADNKTLSKVVLNLYNFGDDSKISHYEVRWKLGKPKNNCLPDSLGPARVYEPLTRLFDRREKPYGWLGSDGGSSARLSDGRDAWAFSDSLLGTADAEGRIETWSMVRNCLIITNTHGDNPDPDMFVEVIGFPNELSLNDAAFVENKGSWTGENGELQLTQEEAAYGSNSMKVIWESKGDVILKNGEGKKGVSVDKGQPVSVKAMIKSPKGRNAKIGIEYYDQDGRLINRHLSEEFKVSSDWTRLHYTGPVPPEETAFASMCIHLPEGEAGDTCYIANCGLFNGDASMQSWSLPGKGWRHENLVNPEEINLATHDALNKNWFWFSGALSIDDNLFVFMNHYGENDGTPPWNFEFKGSQYIGQWDTRNNVFQGITKWSENDPVQWGSTYLKEDNYIYIFGFDDRDHYLMRVPENNIFGLKEYWTGSSWSENRDDADILVTLKQFGGNMDGVTRINDKYCALYIETFGRQIKRLEADSIIGPWEDTNEVVYDIPGMSEELYAYIPRIHNQFTSSDGIVMSYSSGGNLNNESLLIYSSYKFAIGPSCDDLQSEEWSEWSEIRKVKEGDKNITIEGLASGDEIIVEVRAVYKNLRKSVWVQSEPVRTPIDFTPPPQPSKPIVVLNDDNKLVVEWDGKFADNDKNDNDYNDFSHISVHVFEGRDFIPAYWTNYGTLTQKGTVVLDKSLMPNRKYYIRFQAHDLSGNASYPSEQFILYTGS